jgi:hypothetical protein
MSFCLEVTVTTTKSDRCGTETIPGRVSAPERPGRVLVARPGLDAPGAEVTPGLEER